MGGDMGLCLDNVRTIDFNHFIMVAVSKACGTYAVLLALGQHNILTQRTWRGVLEVGVENTTNNWAGYIMTGDTTFVAEW